MSDLDLAMSQPAHHYLDFSDDVRRGPPRGLSIGSTYPSAKGRSAESGCFKTKFFKTVQFGFRPANRRWTPRRPTGSTRQNRSLAPLHDPDHPAAGNESRHEGRNETGQQRNGRNSALGRVEPALHRIEECLAENRDQHHQERKPGYFFLAVAEHQSGRNSRSGTRKTGQDRRESLREPDYESILERNFRFLPGTGVIGERQQRSRNQQRNPHDQQSGCEKFLHIILKEKSDDRHRYHRKHYFANIDRFVVPLETKKSGDQPGQFVAENHNRAAYRSGVHRDGESQVLFALKTEQRIENL